MENLSVPETDRRVPPGAGRVRKRSVIATVFAATSGLILGSYALLGLLLYHRTEAVFTCELKANVLGCAKTVAASIDAAAFSRLYPGCQGNEDFMNVMKTLAIFRDNAGLQYVYTTWYDENGVPVMCVDSDPVAPGDMGDALGYAEATHLALRGTPAVYDSPVTDAWGPHLSAFAPIAYEGKVYGAVGVDMDYAWVVSQLRGIAALIAMICAGCFAATIAVLIVFHRHLKRKFNLLNTHIDVLSFDAVKLTKIEGLQDGDEFEMIAGHIGEVFEKNVRAQREEADKLREAMAEVERKAGEKAARYEEMLAEGPPAAPERGDGGAAPSIPRPSPEGPAPAGTPLPPPAGQTESASEAERRAKAPLLPELDEKVTKEEAVRRVRAAVPELLASYRALIQVLRPYFGSTEEEAPPAGALPEMGAEELAELYEAILEFAEMYDQDSIIRLLRQTEGYAIPEAERERLERIRKRVGDSDWGGLKEILKPESRAS